MSEFAELDRMQEERTKSYDRFEDHGDDFIDVMLSGIPETESLWISSDDILEASEEQKGEFNGNGGTLVFNSIYNLLCNIEILPAFHDSPPYQINSQQYDPEKIIEAWEHVSGEEYQLAEERRGRTQY